METLGLHYHSKLTCFFLRQTFLLVFSFVCCYYFNLFPWVKAQIHSKTKQRNNGNGNKVISSWWCYILCFIWTNLFIQNQPKATLSEIQSRKPASVCPKLKKRRRRQTQESNNDIQKRMVCGCSIDGGGDWVVVVMVLIWSGGARMEEGKFCFLLNHVLL